MFAFLTTFISEIIYMWVGWNGWVGIGWLSKVVDSLRAPSVLMIIV